MRCQTGGTMFGIIRIPAFRRASERARRHAGSAEFTAFRRAKTGAESPHTVTAVALGDWQRVININERT